jgi:NAD(P)-dependent dehydrogenase (short-subunit alcohol dehydrogenase family)
MQEFADKVAVVTGGASGIGYALAERFAAERMKLVLADIEASALDAAVQRLRARGTQAIGVQTDVSKRANLERLLQETLAAYGAVHVLCNNAGVQVAAPAWQVSQGEWEWLLGVNLWGVIHGISVFVPQMLAQGDECHIVNTASMAGLISTPMMAAYQVTKHSVVTLSETLSLDLAQHQSKIGVSVLCPAFVQTNLHESERNRPNALQDESALPAEVRDLIKQSVTALVTGGKPPSEIAEAVLGAIRARRVHVITHPEVMFAFDKRVAIIQAAAKASTGG